jgi:hypothetical protein
MSDTPKISPLQIFPESTQPEHESLAKAMTETHMHISNVKRDTKGRGKWLYLATTESDDFVRNHFSRSIDALVKRGTSVTGTSLAAVWAGQGEPDCEPEF